MDIASRPAFLGDDPKPGWRGPLAIAASVVAIAAIALVLTVVVLLMPVLLQPASEVVVSAPFRW